MAHTFLKLDHSVNQKYVYIIPVFVGVAMQNVVLIDLFKPHFKKKQKQKEILNYLFVLGH